MLLLLMVMMIHHHASNTMPHTPPPAHAATSKGTHVTLYPAKNADSTAPQNCLSQANCSAIGTMAVLMEVRVAYCRGGGGSRRGSNAQR